MNLKAGEIALAVIFCLLICVPLQAQPNSATLYGKITDPSGQAVSHAKITIKNLETGQSAETQSGPDGVYTLSNLTPGDYEIFVAAVEFGAKTARATLTATHLEILDLVLVPATAHPESQPNVPATTQPESLPNAPSIAPASPSAAPASPSLGDLGFTPQEATANPQLQALLEKRTEMLKIHQRLGLITTIPMAASLITGPMAKAKGKNGQPITEPTNANLDFHAALGGATAGLYYTSAYYAIFAPKVPGTQKHGAIRLHEALTFVHGPGMILTPVLGAMAYKQENAGEKVHGIAAAHGAVAYTTAIAYGASIVAVSWPIHWKFWEKQ